MVLVAGGKLLGIGVLSLPKKKSSILLQAAAVINTVTVIINHLMFLITCIFPCLFNKLHSTPTSRGLSAGSSYFFLGQGPTYRFCCFNSSLLFIMTFLWPIFSASLYAILALAIFFSATYISPCNS